MKQQYQNLLRQAAAQSIVLLRNENNTLPLRQGARIALFGRTQMQYYKSGTGSGGMVNAPYVIGIPEALESCVQLDTELREIYRSWVALHPFEKGEGWAAEPWSQAEMPVSAALAAQVAARTDAAVVIIGRTAGEDRDHTSSAGSWLLTQEEEQMLENVCRNFAHVAVLLNVGSIIDMGWVQRYRPDAVLYIWQGGQEGGRGVCDVLTGAVNPCGRLPDTIAKNLACYPSHKNFGDPVRNFYAEDIYVGYRYFETVAQSDVLYPFGFGLSYTTFETSCTLDADGQNVRAKVRNTGAVAGREVVQVYCAPPQGALGNPARILLGFSKTPLLAPNESCELSITLATPMSFDDSGATGNANCWVLEQGNYTYFAGGDVRTAVKIGEILVPQTKRLQQCAAALQPVQPFELMRGAVAEAVPLRSYDLSARIAGNLPADRAEIGNQGWVLADVQAGNCSMETFLDQLPNAALCCLLRGEGMNSPKVTPGTAAAFGGVTAQLQQFGIPIACCDDGPSGLRLDDGSQAYSLPIGTALAATFDEQLMEELFSMLGREMVEHAVDLVLGPGINLHRHPLNGRNFEYFSEDPYLTGRMAAAQLRGLHRQGVSGTIKHFAANNQENKRTEVDSVVSQRALRELYLKPFEIAVKEGKAISVMSTYGRLNGIPTAGNYDLLTTVLRGDWGFDGMVMTDWWASVGGEGEDPSRSALSSMVRAQNDVYMVVSDAAANPDDLEASLQSGALTRGELLRCAANICRVLMQLPAMHRKAKPVQESYSIRLRYRMDAALTAQTPVNLRCDGRAVKTFMLQGTGGAWSEITLTLPLTQPKGAFTLDGAEVSAVTFAD
ncbi:MAG: glycoside hydrolase family 3 C-terminal domain-containing protein [Oscillospiraceae bacterium]|jgi:beta-glucosidase|nr:glycoside hydrolase family 3 C-terminal domain-containing protein [Oscillospiraceae bacterium]